MEFATTSNSGDKNFSLPAPQGSPVDPKQCVEGGTGFALFIGHLVIWTVFLVLSIVTAGIFLVIAMFIPVIELLNRKKAEAALRGSGVAVGPDQFGAIHEAAQVIAQRLGMDRAPDIYIVEDNTLNAAAANVGRRPVVALIDDTVNACLMTGNLQALNFILAHEIAHHALGHTGTVRAYIAMNFKKLSRLDEFSCDRAAARIVPDANAAVNALSILLSGPQLFPYLNRDALIRQAAESEADKHSKKAEKTMTHPLLLRRIHRVLEENNVSS